MNPNDDILRGINDDIKMELEISDEWKTNKYDILDNLFYFIDEKRMDECDAVVTVDGDGKYLV